MASEYPAPAGLVELVDRRYDATMLDSHYILVDMQFQQYHTMYNLKLPESLFKSFTTKYAGTNTAMDVTWDVLDETKSIRFETLKGNNIILLLDSVVDTMLANRQ